MRTMWQRVLHDEGGFWQTLIPTALNLAGSLFGKKKEDAQQVNLAPSWQQILQNQLGSWTSANLAKFNPGEAYKGDLTQESTPQEKTSLGLLDQFLGKPATGDLYGAGRQQIMDTLGGKFADPSQSPFIQAMTKLAGQNLNDQITQARGQAGARGTYYSDSAIGNEGLIGELTQNTLNSIIGQFIQNERQNMLGAADTAKGFDQYENLNAPLAKIAAGQQFGGLERTIEGSNLERQYQDYLRQRTEQQIPVNTALGLASSKQTPDTVIPASESNNTLGNIMEIIQKLNIGGAVGSGDFWGNLFKTT